MNKVVIEKVEAVRDGIVYVSLCGMRADLSHCMQIRLSEIPNWSGVDKDGCSVVYSITAGATIYYDRISFRELINPRFYV